MGQENGGGRKRTSRHTNPEGKVGYGSPTTFSTHWWLIHKALTNVLKTSTMFNQSQQAPKQAEQWVGTKVWDAEVGLDQLQERAPHVSVCLQQ